MLIKQSNSIKTAGWVGTDSSLIAGRNSHYGQTQPKASRYYLVDSLKKLFLILIWANQADGFLEDLAIVFPAAESEVQIDKTICCYDLSFNCFN